MKRLILFFCATLVQLCIPIITIAATGDVFTDGQFKYTVISEELKTLELKGLAVTQEEITGEVIIPETVIYNDATYSVFSIGVAAFNNCNGLTSVKIPSSVITIKSQAFQLCRGLISIVIPDSLTTIENYTFYGCGDLTSIEIPNSVTTIGNGVFYGCGSLKSIELPASLTSIGDKCFAECEQLTTVTSLHTTPPTLGGNAFVKDIATIIVPEEAFSNYQNSDWANYFWNLRKEALDTGDEFISGQFKYSILNAELNTVELKNIAVVTDKIIGDVVIPETVQYNTVTYLVSSIGADVFHECYGITNIEIPNSITTIGDNAFYGCVGLTNITIPNSVTAIGNSTFSRCSNLRNVIIPNSVTTIGERAFSECSSLTSITIPNSVTAIKDASFQYCYNLASIDIPNSITSIGYNVFCECRHLTNITIPNSVTTIGRAAFIKCTGLVIITIPNSITEIGSHTFIGCSNLTNVDIPNSVTTIGGSAFSGCTGLTSIEIPSSVTTIGESAFSGCTGLTSIEIPSSVTTIEKWAFGGCTGLTSIEIPSSVTTIGESAFSRCTGLTSIEIPSSVTTIEKCAFNGCTGLTNVYIPNSVTTIGGWTFTGCNITEIEIPDSVSTIGEGTFWGCTNLTNIKIPDSITIIEDFAFLQCRSLTNIKIPNSVTKIGDKAFCTCTSLTNIKIPSTVTQIGEYCFYECTQLNEVICCAVNPPRLGRDAFENNIANLIVPKIAITSYQNSNWKSYFNNIKAPQFSYTYHGLDLKYAIIDEIAKTAELTNNSSVFGNIILPADLMYNGDKFTLVAIGDGALSDCTELTSVEMPASVSSIGTAAFSGCTKLTEVICHAVIPPTLGSNVFVKDIATITIPEEAFGRYQSSDWTQYFANLKKQELITGDQFENAEFGFTILDDKSNTVTLTSVIYTTGNVTIPRTVSYGEVIYTITSIGESAFNGCPNLTEIEIPASVISIRDSCFKHCTQLTTVISLASTPPTLGEDAFVKDIATVNVPEEALSSYQNSDWALYFTNLAKQVLVAGDKFTSQQLNYTVLDDKLNTVVLTGVDVAADALAGSIVIPETVTYNDVTYAVISIGDEAFSGYNAVTGIDIPASVTEIGASAFFNCSALTTLRLPDAVTTIPEALCSGCSSLEKVYLSDKVNKIGEYAFQYCSSLRSMIVPDGVTEIPAKMMRGCSAITEILIPNSVTKIGEQAFSGCTSLKNVDLGTGVYEIANLAFEKCDKITDLHCMASNPPYAEMYTFPTAAYKDVTVTVREQSLTKYNRENPWYRFEKYLTVAGAVSLSHYEVEMASNEVFQLGVYGSENKIEWTSTNPSVAYANECGLIVAMGIAGTTVISANVDGEKIDCRVTVLAKRTPLMSRAGEADEPEEPVDIILESIGGNPPMVNVRLVPVGSCTVIDWSSSDSSLATVENGLVTVHQAGEVSFGVETGNGLEETLVTDTEELKTSGLQNIVNMEHTAITDNNVYDLSGRCVIVNATPEQISTLRKGIYIVNGKKLLVK